MQERIWFEFSQTWRTKPERAERDAQEKVGQFWCNGCRDWLPHAEFGFQKGRRGNVLSRCKVCTNAKAKERWANQEHREACGKRMKLRNDANKRTLLELFHYVGCSNCGWNEWDSGLDFHHVDPRDKLFVVANVSKPMPERVEESRKCVVLCSNCHRGIRSGDLSLKFKRDTHGWQVWQVLR